MSAWPWIFNFGHCGTSNMQIHQYPTTPTLQISSIRLPIASWNDTKCPQMDVNTISTQYYFGNSRKSLLDTCTTMGVARWICTLSNNGLNHIQCTHFAHTQNDQIHSKTTNGLNHIQRCSICTTCTKHMLQMTLIVNSFKTANTHKYFLYVDQFWNTPNTCPNRCNTCTSYIKQS